MLREDIVEKNVQRGQHQLAIIIGIDGHDRNLEKKIHVCIVSSKSQKLTKITTALTIEMTMNFSKYCRLKISLSAIGML